MNVIHLGLEIVLPIWKRYKEEKSQMIVPPQLPFIVQQLLILQVFTFPLCSNPLNFQEEGDSGDILEFNIG